MHLTDKHVEILHRIRSGEALDELPDEFYQSYLDLAFGRYFEKRLMLTPKGRQALSEVWQDKQKSEKR